ncbi:hypothetical protein KL944_001190 [Ogataea haglerorum]|nr:hypothetical protein KL944_001190 [Ogataea haglerorum]
MSAKLLDRLQLSGIAALLQTTQGSEFGIAQNTPPYYDEILDALRAVDAVETACTLAEEQSLLSYCDGLAAAASSSAASADHVTPVPQSPDSGENPDEREGAPEDARDGFNDGKVRTTYFTFQGKVKKYVYLDKLPGDADETVLVLTNRNEVFVSHNQGQVWEEVAPDDEFLDIYVDPHRSTNVYLLAVNDKIVYSLDRADNWKSFRTPSKAVAGIATLYFHPSDPKRLIFMGQEGCNDPFSKACRLAAYHTYALGKRWLKIQENVRRCEFAGGEWILCEKDTNEATEYRSSLVASADLFKSRSTLLDRLVGVGRTGEYWVAATEKAHDALQPHVSLDGVSWAPARLPPNIQLSRQQAYTVLSGSSKAVFMHVTTNPVTGTEYGTILKSNSNGTEYVSVLESANRDEGGYVDFEKITGLEGLIVANVVANPDDARKGARKRIRSVITHNDGAQWAPLQPPVVDSENQRLCSGQSLEQCSLHLHGFTERADYRDTFASASAVGMMIGVGNVGPQLGSYYDGHTFLTKDGGITWKEVRKGVYLWEYGDQGSVIVLVNGKDNTNVLSYSVDEGDTWVDFQFTKEQVTVEDISTVPGDNSLVFMLFTRVPLARGDKTRVFRVDFSQLLSKKCSADDFETWTPKHPFQADNCLFGHEVQYTRKIPGRLCQVGARAIAEPKIVRNCKCTRQDYECDFNYYLTPDGLCRLVPSYSPPSHEDICLADNAPVGYYPATGYRKIPLSTCEGGTEFDKSEEPVPCKGREEEFNRLHPRLGLLAALLLWAVAAVVAGYSMRFAYKWYTSRHGEIRLDDDGGFTFVDVNESVWAQWRRFVVDSALSSLMAVSRLLKRRRRQELPVVEPVPEPSDDEDFTE